jgi:pyruvate dehydrogenase E1 component alpha subunit
LKDIRENGGPYLLEIMTYRYRGHSMGDPERYREKDEVKKWEEEDPIGIFRKYLMENEIASEAELDEQDEIAQETIDEAVEFAESSPNPEDEALFENVYVEPTPVEYAGYAMENESEG